MPSLLAPALSFAVMPMALLMPFMGQGGELAAGSALAGANTGVNTGMTAPQSDAPDNKRPDPDSLIAPQFPRDAATTAPLDAFYNNQTVRQIRIERRVTIRVFPRRLQNRQDMLARLPRLAGEYEEGKKEKCLPVSRIGGVQTGSGNRLLLFMRDSRIISINLEKACRARDFYSGFYVEQNKDGKLCVDRDKLQSRSGAKCEVERMRQLVAVKN